MILRTIPNRPMLQLFSRVCVMDGNGQRWTTVPMLLLEMEAFDQLFRRHFLEMVSMGTAKRDASVMCHFCACRVRGESHNVSRNRAFKGVPLQAQKSEIYGRGTFCGVWRLGRETRTTALWQAPGWHPSRTRPRSCWPRAGARPGGFFRFSRWISKAMPSFSCHDCCICAT